VLFVGYLIDIHDYIIALLNLLCWCHYLTWSIFCPLDCTIKASSCCDGESNSCS